MGEDGLGEINFDFEKFMKDLGSDSPTPGGGSVAALSGALGAALTSMVARLTIKKIKDDPEFEKELENIIATSDNATNRFMKLIVADAAAYDAVIEAFKMPKETEEDKEARRKAIQDSFKHASEIPMYVVELAHEILAHARTLVERGNESAISDSAVAISMLGSAIRGGKMNVEINLKYIKEDSFNNNHSGRLSELQKTVDRFMDESNKIIEDRL